MAGSHARHYARSRLALHYEYNRARFSGWGAPIPAPILERDEEAIRELSNDEIREHSGGRVRCWLLENLEVARDSSGRGAMVDRTAKSLDRIRQIGQAAEGATSAYVGAAGAAEREF
jgi:hypothetical protein